MNDIIEDRGRGFLIEIGEKLSRLHAENAALKADLIAEQGYRAAAEEIATRRGEMVDALIAERDEARRDLCMSEAIDRLHDAHPNAPISRSASIRIANEIAVDRGWDCFDAKEGR